MRTRLTSMIDLKTFEPRFGVDVNIGNGWSMLIQDGFLFYVNTKEEAEAKRAEIRSRHRKLTPAPTEGDPQ